jgi:hypothetical protein
MVRVARSNARFKTWHIVLFTSLVLLLIAAGVGLRLSAPHLKKRALAILGDRFDADVTMDSFSASLYPNPHIHGSGIYIRKHNDPIDSPEIAIKELDATATIKGLFGSVADIKRVTLQGLHITIRKSPSGTNDDQDDQNSWLRKKHYPVDVHELVADNAQITIVPANPDKDPQEYFIQKLTMHSVGLERAATFTTQIHNAVPPGIIDSHGRFGPWNPVDAGKTPLDANYTFNKADLGVFDGIRGTLSSKGKFGGKLEKIEVSGTTDTPDFALKDTGHPMALHTDFSATVDGTDGDTYLHPVRATLGHSVIVASGAVEGKKGVPGKQITLDATVNNGRIEDMLRLAMKSDKPMMTGDVSLHSKIVIERKKADILDRLKLDGRFEVANGGFTNATLNQKVKELSRKGKGEPENENAGSDVTNLKGDFRLVDAVLTMRNLNFSVEGAQVNLNGVYAMKPQKLDFHGHLYMQAKLSQTMTGFKSWLLKPFDPFFRKDHRTSVPIKVTGNPDHPEFGLDLFNHNNRDDKKTGE